ncbi:MAG: M23 family metallopeptidase [Saprospiraceae bacterium]
MISWVLSPHPKLPTRHHTAISKSSKIEPSISEPPIAAAFLSPVHREISLSGTFGELRPNHFHAGLDIKSVNGRVGEAVYSTAKGYVARIKISAYGYGRAIYIQHPDGKMSVYGHLDHFTPDLDNYILKEHYKRKRFEIDLNPPPGLFTVSQGQLIAYMGNSGSSTGPHLHFEIRNAAEEVLNPLEFGIPLRDDKAPDIYAIKLYSQNHGISLPLMNLPVTGDIQGTFRLAQDTILVNSDFTGLAIKTFDQLPQNNSRLGVYGIKLFCDDQLKYHFDMKALSFDEMRYSNAHRDYEEEIKSNQRFHRLFRLAGNKLPIYQQSVNDGWIALNTQNLKKIKIEVYDFAGNVSFLQFYLKQALGPMSAVSMVNNRYINYAIPYKMEDGNFKMNIPANRLYADIYLKYEEIPVENAYSDLYKVHDSTIPLHKSFSISIKPRVLPSTLKNKAVVASLRGKFWTSHGGTWDGEWLQSDVNSFGNYAVIVDTEAPSIKPIIFTTDMKKRSLMAFKITDNLGVSGKADEITYNAYIDDQWVLMELDSKTDIITHRFDAHTTPGKHQLRLRVKDDRGNEKTFVQTFVK